jgi:hypothetical protein
VRCRMMAFSIAMAIWLASVDKRLLSSSSKIFSWRVFWRKLKRSRVPMVLDLKIRGTQTAEATTRPNFWKE